MIVRKGSPKFPIDSFKFNNPHNLPEDYELVFDRITRVTI